VSTTICLGGSFLGPNSVLHLLKHFDSWYKRTEFGIRAALFFSAATVSGAFGGLLAVSREFTRAPMYLTLLSGCNLKYGWNRWQAGLGLDLVRLFVIFNVLVLLIKMLVFSKVCSQSLPAPCPSGSFKTSLTRQNSSLRQKGRLLSVGYRAMTSLVLEVKILGGSIFSRVCWTGKHGLEVGVDISSQCCLLTIP